MTTQTNPPVVVELSALSDLISALLAEGYQVIGPRLGDSAIVYEPLESAEQLPVGWSDEQDV